MYVGHCGVAKWIPYFPPSSPLSHTHTHTHTYTGLTADSRCVGVARVGTSNQHIANDRLSSISEWDLGGPLHSMVVVGTVHPLEEKMLTLASNAAKSAIT